MGFPLNVYLLALLGGLIASAASLPLWRAWCRHTGHVDDPGHRKIHSEPIALAGGLAVFTGIALPIVVAIGVVALGLFDPATQRAVAHGLARRGPQLAAVLGGCLAMVALGWLDDRYELRPATKFGGQVLIALIVAASGVRITLFVPSAVFSLLITALWIVTLTNAFNFLDNMNGLCAGVGAVAAFAFGMKAAIGGQYLVALLAFLAFGALAGFLPYNFPKASAFLGDAGSHLVGFLLAVLAILPHFYSTEHPIRLAVFNPLLILVVPLVDMAWVVIIRWRLGKPFYVGDNNHLSHRLVRRGLTKPRAVLVIWLLATLAAAAAFV